jgi:3',5'-cyclic AMP phosphodiesterase CpdA
MLNGLTRREVLGGLAVGAGAVALPGIALGGLLRRGGGAPGRVARIAHLTDIHIQPEKGAAEGLAACLKHVQDRADKPDLIVTGGDLIMDAFGADEARTKLQWELLTRTFKDHCGLRVEHTLGNHDIWGWNKSKSKTTGDEARWGKRWALDTLGLDKLYRAFDVGSWRIFLLDSVHPDPADPNGYIGAIDPAQMEWLAADLAAARGRHVLVVSHIPILTVTVILGDSKDGKKREVSDGLMLTNSAAVRSALEKAGNVRACLSGHLHRIDRVDFRGISYCCNGAVCGRWWDGANAEAREGYTLVDLFEDGRVECAYTPYGWTAQK